MLFDFKGHKVSNSLNVFTYYKKLTGNSLESDLKNLSKLEKTVNTPGVTDEQISKAVEENDIDGTEIFMYIYYSMRCAGEQRDLELSSVIDEIDINDIADGTIQELISKLVEVKKKEVTDNRRRGFLLGRK